MLNWVDPGSYVLDLGCTLAPLVNTIEPSVCGADAALCQITLTTFYCCLSSLLPVLLKCTTNIKLQRVIYYRKLRWITGVQGGAPAAQRFSYILRALGSFSSYIIERFMHVGL